MIEYNSGGTTVRVASAKSDLDYEYDNNQTAVAIATVAEQLFIELPNITKALFYIADAIKSNANATQSLADAVNNFNDK